jgi:hypothetical protein
MAGGLPSVDYEPISLKGGLDLITPTLSLAPGACKDALNFECSVTGGYSRIAGYERFDGHALPSTKSFLPVTVVSFANTPSVGDTLTGNTSGATGVVAAVQADSVALCDVSGTFELAEQLKHGADLVGYIQDIGVTASVKQSTEYQAAAADYARAGISAVPGSGPVRGVSIFGGDVYAWRDNAGATAMVMHKSTTSGWLPLDLGYQVAFTNANASVQDGDTLTKGGVTATINRVVVESGTLTSGTNTGKLIITAPSGGSFSAGAATSTGAGALTLSGAETAITLAPGGRVETVIGNFTGSASTTRMYGVDGINKAFEFDSSGVYVPISTGATPDNPKHVAVHRNHLFLAQYSSLMHSAIGDPYNFSITGGAGEIAVGDVITGMLNQPGSQTSDSIAIYGRANTFILYGTNSTNWSLTMFNRGVGGIDYTCQNTTSSFVLDDRGVMTLQTSLNYGNFNTAALTANIMPFITANARMATASCVNIERSQYRVFFSNGKGLYVTMANGQYLGSMPVEFADPVMCIANDENSSGMEITYFGSDNGYVYRLDSGTSFDGVAINAFFRLNFDSVKSPRIIKRYRKCAIEMTGQGYTETQFGYQLGYNTSEKSQPGINVYTQPFSAVYWDQFTWDAFIWDGATLLPVECEMTGSSENVAIIVGNSTAYTSAFTVNSLIMHFTHRRGMR